jgi:hypothetical protein
MSIWGLVLKYGFNFFKIISLKAPYLSYFDQFLGDFGDNSFEIVCSTHRFALKNAEFLRIFVKITSPLFKTL